MQIGVLYICTGKHSIFWKFFYESSEKHFLARHQKKYFVFTDAQTIDYQDNKNVVVVFQENEICIVKHLRQSLNFKNVNYAYLLN